MKLLKRITLCSALVFLTLPAIAQNRDFELGKSTEILINAMRELNYFYVEEIDPGQVLQNGLDGIVSGLDPYTGYISEEQIEEFEVMTTGKYGGIGSIIRQKDEWIFIAEPYRDSPSDKAGFRIGDKIVEIDGKSVKGVGSAVVSSMLKGDPGTDVTVTLERGTTGQMETITLTRERISISGIPYHGFVEDGIGYIRHSDFTEDCSSDMRKALMELKTTGELRGLILDYRGNGGGILQEAVKILSLFVPKGTEVVSMKGRLESSEVKFRTETEPVDTQTPIVVLVNGGSASAAEIVSGALQDLDRAVVMGQRTYGKGLVQSTRPVGYDSYMKITTAKYYIPSGRCIQAVDYAHRDEEGAVISVPDSLIREYVTRAGRKVYDGGGIMPDVKLPPEYVSRFTIITYAKGYINDFVDLNHTRFPADIKPGAFRLSDEQYGWFKEYMKDKDVEYRSETSMALETLKEKATRERYLDRIEEGIALIVKGIVDDKEGNLDLYRDQISSLLEDELLLRQHYRKGVIEHGLTTDPEVKKAAVLLGEAEEYHTIVTTQDTTKK